MVHFFLDVSRHGQVSKSMLGFLAIFNGEQQPGNLPCLRFNSFKACWQSRLNVLELFYLQCIMHWTIVANQAQNQGNNRNKLDYKNIDTLPKNFIRQWKDLCNLGIGRSTRTSFPLLLESALLIGVAIPWNNFQGPISLILKVGSNSQFILHKNPAALVPISY